MKSFVPRWPFLPLPPLAAGGLCYFLSSAITPTETPAASGSSVVEAESPEVSRVKSLAARVDAASDLPALIPLWEEARRGSGDAYFKNRLTRRIYGRMAELDPAGALAWMKSLPSGTEPYPFYDFLLAWTARDWKAAGEAVLSGPSEDRRHIQWVLTARAKTDPAGLLKDGIPEEWGIKDSFLIQSAYHEALGALSEKDLAGALELAPAHLKDTRYYAAHSLLKKLAAGLVREHGPAEAYARAGDLKNWPESARNFLRAQTLPELARAEGPERAAAEYLKVAHRDSKQTGAVIAGLWAKSDPGAAFQWAMSIPEESFSSQVTRDTALAAVLKETGADADFLLRMTGAQPADAVSGRGEVWQMQAVLSCLPAHDSAKLVKDLAAAPAGTHREALLTAAVAQWSRADPSAALKALEELPPEAAERAKEAFEWSLRPGGMERLSPEERLDFIRRIHDDAGLSKASGSHGYREAVQSITREEPAAGLELLSTAPEGVKPDLSRAVFSAWAEARPAEAARAVFTLPEALRPDAVLKLTGSWAAYDPMSASVWADSLPAGPERDAAAGALSSHLQREEPESAFAWAAGISAEEPRRQALETVLKTWMREDAPAARAAVENAPHFSDEQRAAFRKLFEENQP